MPVRRFLFLVSNTLYPRVVWAVGYKDRGGMELAAVYRREKEAWKHADDGDDYVSFASVYPVRIRRRYRDHAAR